MNDEPLPDLDMEPTGYRIQLCHRRRPGITRKEVQTFWQRVRAKTALALKPDLGFSRYTFIAQVAHPSLLGEVMAGSRKFLPVAIVNLLLGNAVPPLEGSPIPLEAEEFDVVDEFHYDSLEQLATVGLRGLSAAQKLAELTGNAVERTVAVIGPQYQVLPCEGNEGTKVTFCLRRKAEQDRSTMQKYWLRKHGALVKSLQSRLECRGYEQVHTVPDTRFEEIAEIFGATEPTSFDGTASLWYKSESSLRRTFIKPACLAANYRLEQDEQNFVDDQRCVLVFGSLAGEGAAKSRPRRASLRPRMG